MCLLITKVTENQKVWCSGIMTQAESLSKANWQVTGIHVCWMGVDQVWKIGHKEESRWDQGHGEEGNVFGGEQRGELYM